MMLLVNPIKEYENYRWFYTSNGVLAIGGKSDEQNESVLKKFLEPDFTVMHTSEPGSPFVILQSNKPSKKDIDEASIYCGCFSKQWKLGKRTINIDIFKGEQIYKNKVMKNGTFGVKGEKKTIKVKPELFLTMQKGRLRAVPSIGKGEKKLAVIKPGKLSKEEASEKIAKKLRNEFGYPISKDEILQAIPSDKLGVK